MKRTFDFYIPINKKDLMELKELLLTLRDESKNKLNYRLESFDSNPASSINANLSRLVKLSNDHLKRIDSFLFKQTK